MYEYKHGYATWTWRIIDAAVVLNNNNNGGKVFMVEVECFLEIWADKYRSNLIKPSRTWRSLGKLSFRMLIPVDNPIQGSYKLEYNPTQETEVGGFCLAQLKETG